jgi:type I restriction enzyme S subunit
MRSEWKEYTVGEISNINPETLKNSHDIEYIEYLDTSSVTENQFLNYEVLAAREAPSRAKRIVYDEDIVISTVRPNLKHYGFIKNPKPNMIVSTGFAVIRSRKNIVEPKFLYYYLTLDSNTQYLATIADGSTSTYPSIKPSVIADLTINLPPLPIQKKIAHILSTLDDKIELNRKMNQTLEAMAQALFKSWFVDEVKEEWIKYRLGDILELKYGKDHKTLPDGNIPVYGSGGIMRYANTFLYDKESILIPRKGTLSNIFYINEPFWTVDTIFWSKINIKYVFGSFLFYYLKTIDFSNFNVGSAVPSLTTKVLNEIEVTLPSLEEQKEFSNYADNAWRIIRANEKEIQTLQKTRDTLLPKLLSGELDVSEIEL